MLDVEYEQILRDQQSVPETVSAFVGFEERVTFNPAKNRYKKMRDARNALWTKKCEETLRKIKVAQSEEAIAQNPPEAFEAETTLFDRPETARPSEVVEVGLKIRNVSDHVWREVGKKDGSLWNGVTSYRYHGAEEVPVYYQFISPIPCKLAPGESAKVDLHIFAPDKPGTYRLEVVFAQTEVGHTLDPNALSVKVERDQNERDALRYFEVEDVDTEGWIWTEWMGSVSIGKFPWIYSTRFGWLYCADRPQEAEEYWFFREDLGWFWTNPEKVPHVWSMDREKWLHAELAEQTRERFLTPEAG